ncbi:MAG: HigA family addiction module antitoxin [Paracoccaceae bacterium]|jgi:addiction module HigA family antidote|nr:HigA family addiction module antitoxin [Paracoccaceae bacterium]MDP7186919.1 HigA family addiction module antitoxin [Paracoccaceae bacterium]
MLLNTVHPGEILELEFLKPLGISKLKFARAIGVPRTRVERLVAGTTGITPDTALRLGRALGTSAQFWMNLQVHHDLTKTEAQIDLSEVEFVNPTTEETKELADA